MLERLRLQPDDESWDRLAALYTPLLRVWLRRHDLQPADADDLVQEVLGIVVREMPKFEYNGRPGAFRAWLRGVLANCLRRFWRAGRYRPTAPGGSDFEQQLAQLEDPASGLSQLWDQEHDRHVLARLLEMIETEFQPATWKAFRRLVFDAIPAAVVAAESGLSVNAVLIAKSHVLRRLREEGRGLVD